MGRGLVKYSALLAFFNALTSKVYFIASTSLLEGVSLELRQFKRWRFRCCLVSLTISQIGGTYFQRLRILCSEHGIARIAVSEYRMNPAPLPIFHAFLHFKIFAAHPSKPIGHRN